MFLYIRDSQCKSFSLDSNMCEYRIHERLSVERKWIELFLFAICITTIITLTVILTCNTGATREVNDFYDVKTIGACKRLLWDNNYLDVCNHNSSQQIFIKINNGSCSMSTDDWEKFKTIVIKVNKYIYALA